MNTSEMAFIKLVIEQTSAAQSGNALTICQSLCSIARQRKADLLSIDCSPDCKKHHTLAQAALLLNRSPKTVTRLIQAGKLETSERGRLVSHISIRDYLDSKIMSVLSL
jgi:hypothetical protein